MAWEGRLAALGESHSLTHQSLRELTKVMRRSGRGEDAKSLLATNECHDTATRYPYQGNALLVSGRQDTHIRPKGGRALRGATFLVRDPGPPDADPTLLRRSFSMGSELRRPLSSSMGTQTRRPLTSLGS